MNTAAEQHLAKAKDYVARGEEFYRKAAEEIEAALSLGATWVDAGDAIGHSDEWCKKIVAWSKIPANDNKSTMPFSEPQGAVAQRHARSVLRDMPAKQIADTYLADPKVRLKVRQALDSSEAKWTPPRHEPAGPTFIDLICKIRDAQQGLDRMMKAWTGPEAIPAEFSPSTFIQIAETAMAQKDRVEQLRAADHDEFQQIIRNFKVVSGVER